MKQAMSREMFRLWAPQQRRRHERLVGVPFESALESAGHVRMKANVWLALSKAIASAGLDCEALPDGLTVEIGEDTDYQPDAIVNWGPRMDPDAMAATNPVVVVEVLSPQPHAIDTGEKLADYFHVPSIQHYLIVRSRPSAVVHHRRAADGIETRIVLDGEIALDPPGLVVSLSDFYRG